MVAALSIVRMDPSRSMAEVIGDVGGSNASWLEGHLEELEGDVVLDCTRLRLRDLAGARVLSDFGARLARAGRSLTLRGVSRGTLDVVASGTATL